MWCYVFFNISLLSTSVPGPSKITAKYLYRLIMMLTHELRQVNWRRVPASQVPVHIYTRRVPMYPQHVAESTAARRVSQNSVATMIFVARLSCNIAQHLCDVCNMLLDHRSTIAQLFLSQQNLRKSAAAADYRRWPTTCCRSLKSLDSVARPFSTCCSMLILLPATCRNWPLRPLCDWNRSSNRLYDPGLK